MPKCKCGKYLEPDEKNFSIGSEIVCRECWCQALGDYIEKYPISSPKEEKTAP